MSDRPRIHSGLNSAMCWSVRAFCPWRGYRIHMPQQLQLLEVPKPLVGRFGEDFFRAAPRCPGVYIMTGPNERVLYIGQSKNLRVRLASYKNARPDRASRKTIRLVRQVQSIVWETCQDPEAAQLRENELLRLHRPKFNKVNTYPKAYTFIS